MLRLIPYSLKTPLLQRAFSPARNVGAVTPNRSQSSHSLMAVDCARHTFGTLALSKGMPIESVSRVLGHTNIVTTQIYAKITTQKLDNDLTMFGNKLNASFGSVTP